MNIAVNPSRRHADISAPAVFAVGEAQTVTLSGLTAPDLATLKLALYGLDGTVLALCAAFATSGCNWKGTLNTRTANAAAAFSSQKPDARLPVLVVLADDNLLWFTAAAEMANNPLRASPTAPDPSLRYLTRQDFCSLPDITDDMTLDAVYDRLRRVIEGLRGP